MLSTLFLLSLASLISLFSGQMLVPILLCVLLATLFFQWKEGGGVSLWKFLSDFSPLQLGMIFIIVGYVLASCFWGITPLSSAKKTVRIALLCLVGGYCFAYFPLSVKSIFLNSRAIWQLIFSVIVAASIALFEVNADGIITKAIRHADEGYKFYDSALNRGSAYLSLLIWACAFFLYTKRMYLALLVVVGTLCYTVFSLSSLTAVAALAAALLTFVGCLIFKERMMKFAIIGMLSVVVLTPFLAAQTNPVSITSQYFSKAEGSIIHRIFIWDFVAKKAMEKPILGWGFDASRAMPVIEEDKIPDCWGATVVTDDCRWADEKRPHPLPLHPHNGTLQIWLELGLIGVALYAIILGMIGLQITNAPIGLFLKSCYFSLFLQFIVIQQTGFGIWQNWLWAAFFLALIQLKLMSRKEDIVAVK